MRRRRICTCACCGESWSVFASLHQPGCSARWLIARGERERAKQLYRSHPERGVKCNGKREQRRRVIRMPEAPWEPSRVLLDLAAETRGER